MNKIFMIVLAVCVVNASGAYADDWVTNNATLNQLRLDFTNRVYNVATNRIEATFVWVSKPYAITCQRPLNLYLVSNQIGAFVNLKGWTFTNSLKPYADLMSQIEKDVQTYLAKMKIKEEKIVVHGNIYRDYILK